MGARRVGTGDGQRRAACLFAFALRGCICIGKGAATGHGPGGDEAWMQDGRRHPCGAHVSTPAMPNDCAHMYILLRP